MTKRANIKLVWTTSSGDTFDTQEKAELHETYLWLKSLIKTADCYIADYAVEIISRHIMKYADVFPLDEEEEEAIKDATKTEHIEQVDCEEDTLEMTLAINAVDKVITAMKTVDGSDEAQNAKN